MIGDDDRILSFDGLRNIWLHYRFQQAEVAGSDPRVEFVIPGDHVFGVAPSLMGDYGNVGASSLQLLWIMGDRRVLLSGTDGRHQPRESGPEHFHPDYVLGGFLGHAPARTDAWCDAVPDARAHSMELRLRSPGSALSEIEGLDQDTGTLEQAMAWLGR